MSFWCVFWLPFFSLVIADRVAVTLVSMVSRTQETATGGGEPDPSCNFTLTMAVPGVRNIAPVRACKFQDDVKSPATRVFNELVFAANDLSLAPTDAVSVAVALDCSEQNCKLGDSCVFDTTCAVEAFADSQRQSASQTLAFVRGRDVELVVGAGVAFNLTFRLSWVVPTSPPTPMPPPTPPTTTLSTSSAAPTTPAPTTASAASVTEALANASTPTAGPAPAGVGTPVIIGVAVGASAFVLVLVLVVILVLVRREKKKGASSGGGASGDKSNAPLDDDVVVANSAYNRVPSLADSRESFDVPDAPHDLGYGSAPPDVSPDIPPSTHYAVGQTPPPPGYTGLISATERQKNEYLNATELRNARKKDVYVEAPSQGDKAKF